MSSTISLPRSFKTVPEYRVTQGSTVSNTTKDREAVPLNLKDVQDVASAAPVPALLELDKAGVPGSIQAALHYFDAESHLVQQIEAKNNSKKKEVETKKSQELPKSKHVDNNLYLVEKNTDGHVIRTRFASGEVADFKYSDEGNLLSFIYAGLVWQIDELGIWYAKDKHNDYRIEAKIEILPDGSLQIIKDDLTRIIKLNGTRVDQYKAGYKSESRKIKNTASPYDLLAKAKPTSALWLNSRSSATNFSVVRVPEKIQDVNFTLTLQNSVQEEKARVHADFGAGKLKQDIVCWKARLGLAFFGRLTGQNSANYLRHLDELAQIYVEKGQLELAERTHLKALQIKKEYFGAGQPELAVNVFALARIAEDRQNLQSAEQMYQQAISLYEQCLRKHLFLYSQNLISTEKLMKTVEALFCAITSLAELYSQQNKFLLARELYEMALACWTEITEKDKQALEPLLQSTIKQYIAVMDSLSEVSAVPAVTTVTAV